jgi:arylsulfatase A
MLRGCCVPLLLALIHAVGAGDWSVEPTRARSSRAAAGTVVPPVAHRRRNTIIIFADDFGFDVAAFGAPTVRTPNIDKLASEGAKLTQYYSGENVCTPSRGAILTGRHAARSGLIIDVPWKTCGQGLSGSAKVADACADVFHPDSSGHLPTGEITLAEALKRAAGGQNYATAALSKWHLGYSLINGTQRYLPTSRGFDYFHGTPATHCESGGAWPPEPVFMTDPQTHTTNMVGRLDAGWSHMMGTSNLTQSYAAYGARFITTAVQAKQPFFLYAAFDNTHNGLYFAKEWAGSRRGQIGSATEELDWAVGQLLDAVVSAGVEHDTTGAENASF